MAEAQKCLAFHTTPLGPLVLAQPEVYEKQRERGNQEGEKIERGLGLGEMMERK